MKKYNKTYHNFSAEELDTLLRESTGGNSKAFEELSEYIREIAFNYFQSKYRLGKLRTVDDAEDLANNVFISFSEQFKKIDNIEHWLRRVLFLMFVNWHKKEKKHTHFELNENFNLSADVKRPDISIDSQKIVALLNTLKENKRIIIEMKFWQGLKFYEIAEKLNKNESAVKKMFYRSLEEIKEKLE